MFLKIWFVHHVLESWCGGVTSKNSNSQPHPTDYDLLNQNLQGCP